MAGEFIDWYALGFDQGTEISKHKGGTVANDQIDDIGFGLGRDWLNGVLNGIAEAGAVARGIRISNSLVAAMRGTEEYAPFDQFKDVPFAMSEDLFPNSTISVVMP